MRRLRSVHFKKLEQKIKGRVLCSKWLGRQNDSVF